MIIPENMTHEEEVKFINFKSSQWARTAIKMNKKLKHVQITEVKVKLNEPKPERAKFWWERIFRK